MTLDFSAKTSYRDRVSGRSAAARESRAEDAARRLRDVLRLNVFSFAYPDALLPSEGELMLTHGARRATVREALAMLRAEGVVERVPGIGTYAVRERHIARLGELHGETSPDPKLARYDRAELLDRSVIIAPDHVAQRLDVAPGSQVLRVEYVASIDGVPLGMATNYFAFPEAELVADAPFETDIYSLLDALGIEIAGSEWVLSTVNADPSVARLLDVDPGTALMVGEELVWDRSGRAYDFAICYLRTDRYVFSSSVWTIGARGAAAPLASTETIVQRDQNR